MIQNYCANVKCPKCGHCAVVTQGNVFSLRKHLGSIKRSKEVKLRASQTVQRKQKTECTNKIVTICGENIKDVGTWKKNTWKCYILFL